MKSQERGPRIQVFPEGFEKRSLFLSDAAKRERSQLFADAKLRSRDRDASAITSLLQEIHGSDHEALPYTDRLFPSFEHLSDAQQHLVIDTFDPQRLANTELDDAPSKLSRALLGQYGYSFKDRWFDLKRSLFYGLEHSEQQAALQKYLAVLAKQYPTKRVLYPGSGFDRTISNVFGSDSVVHLSRDDFYFEDKHEGHDFDHQPPDVDVTGDVRAMPFYSEVFDGAVLKGLHPGALLSNNGQGLAEISRVLQPGGKLFVAIADSSDRVITEAIAQQLRHIKSYRWIEVFEKP